MTLNYKLVNQCPCCGHVGPLAIRISSGIQNTITHGTFYMGGSGIGLGAGGLGIGIGGMSGSYSEKSTQSTRLQDSVDQPLFKGKDTTQNVIKLFTMIALFLLVGAVGRSCVVSMPETTDVETTPQITIASAILEMAPYLIMGFFFIFCFMFIFRFFEAQKDDQQDAEVAKNKNALMERYYETLRYCENCHVVYDEAGYATIAKTGAVLKLAENASVLSGKKVGSERVVNQKIS